MRLSIAYFLLKSAIFPIIFSSFNLYTGIIISFTVLLIYRPLIGLIFNLKPMPAMDITTFLGTK